MNSEIPKIIHQIFGLWDTSIPKEIQKRIDTWKRLHPNYKYILWDKKKCRNFLKKKYDWFLPIYDNYSYHVQRADSIRYFILYEYGGVYSDIDLEPVKSIDTILTKYKHKQSILYRSPNSDMLTNDFMISKPKNIFWKKMINELVVKHNFSSMSKHLTIMYSTGPLLLDNVYYSFDRRRKYVFIIDTKYINNCDVTVPKPARNKHGYLKRYDGRSWHSIDSTIIDFFIVHYKFIIILLITVIILKCIRFL
jgi:mannosyltransferase OCH1-like enzyme